VIYDYTSLKYLPIYRSFVKAAKSIHHIELGSMACTDFFKLYYLKILPCVCFIRLRGRQRCVESEKGDGAKKFEKHWSTPTIPLQSITISLKRMLFCFACRTATGHFIVHNPLVNDNWKLHYPFPRSTTTKKGLIHNFRPFSLMISLLSSYLSRIL